MSDGVNAICQAADDQYLLVDEVVNQLRATLFAIVGDVACAHNGNNALCVQVDVAFEVEYQGSVFTLKKPSGIVGILVKQWFDAVFLNELHLLLGPLEDVLRVAQRIDGDLAHPVDFFQRLAALLENGFCIAAVCHEALPADVANPRN